MSNLSNYLSDLEAELTSKTVKVGWFPSSVYPDGETVAFVALQNELGDPAKKIPPRPFIRPTIQAQKDKWVANIGSMIKTGMAAKDVLELTALSMQADIHKAIIDVETPELAKRTLDARKARGNSNESPLNDTGYMLATLIGTVEDK